MTRKRTVQAIEYLLSGGVYFWTGYGVFAFLWSVLGWSLWWAKLLANVAGWTINYIMQRFWVFSSKNSSGKTTKITSRYVVITLVDFGLDYLIVYGLKSIGISPYIGQFISAAFFTIWNYFWYRFWVFPDKLDKHKFRTTLARLLAHRAHGQIGV